MVADRGLYFQINSFHIFPIFDLFDLIVLFRNISRFFSIPSPSTSLKYLSSFNVLAKVYSIICLKNRGVNCLFVLKRFSIAIKNLKRY